MSQQVYNNEIAAVTPPFKPFIDQRVTALENAVAGPVTPNRLAYFSGATSNTLTSSPFTVTGNNLSFPSSSVITVNALAAVAPPPGMNYINIAGVNVGLDAPVGSLIVGAPINAVDANALQITGSTLRAQLANNLFPGVVSTAGQTFSGQKAFQNGMLADVIGGFSAVTMQIGAGSINMTLAPSSGNITIDPIAVGSGQLFIGNTGASAVNIGRSGISTIVSGQLEFLTADRPGIINIGTTNSTGINIGRLGITTTVTGTLSAQTIDRVGPINIGATSATAISVGRSGITTTNEGFQVFNQTVATDLIQARTAATMVIGTNSGGMAIGSTNGTIGIDQQTTGANINIGVTNATGVTIGRAGNTVNFPGPTMINALTITAAASQTSTFAAAGCIPATPNYMTFTLQLINNVCRMTYRTLVAPIAVTSNGTLQLSSTIAAPFQPVAGVVMMAMVSINGNATPGRISVTTGGAISFDVQAGINMGVSNFVIGQTIAIASGFCSWLT